MVDLSIVIPAYDEEARIGPTLLRTLAYLDQRGIAAEVIVVDDGSRDATAEIVRATADKDPRVRLLRLPRNQGKGAAVRAGMLAAQGRQALFMDADLATPLSELARLEAALAEGADVAIGSRALAESHIEARQHPLRECLGKTFNLLIRLAGLATIRDTQCGFKLFRGDVARALFSEARVDRFAFDVEILLLCRGRFRVAEVPVAWRHVERSKVALLTDPARMLYDIVRLRLRMRR
jgi:dolichyl-phosphate beta-glucosyltransferase